MGFIYKIINIITNKCYIGETKKSNPESRWKQHINTIKNGVGCPALQSAVHKYGIENFKFEILLHLLTFQTPFIYKKIEMLL